MGQSIIIVIYIMSQLYRSFKEIKNLGQSKRVNGHPLDELQLKFVYQGQAYAYILLISGCFFMFLYLMQQKPVSWDVICLMILVMVVAETFKKVWLILHHADLSKNEDEKMDLLRIVVSALILMGLAWLTYRMDTQRAISLILLMIGAGQLVTVLAKYYRQYLDLNPLDEEE